MLKYLTLKSHPILIFAAIGFAVATLVNEGSVVNAGLPFGLLDQTGCCQRCPS